RSSSERSEAGTTVGSGGAASGAISGAAGGTISNTAGRATPGPVAGALFGAAGGGGATGRSGAFTSGWARRERTAMRASSVSSAAGRLKNATITREGQTFDVLQWPARDRRAGPSAAAAHGRSR